MKPATMNLFGLYWHLRRKDCFLNIQAMYIATVEQAQTELAQLIERALAGEEIIITRPRQLPVRLMVLTNAQGTRRLGGAWGGQVYGARF